MPGQLANLPELKFETVAEHHTRQVPSHRRGIAREWSEKGFAASDSIQPVKCRLPCRRPTGGPREHRDLFAAGDDVPIEAIMYTSPPLVTPNVDQELAAWQAIRNAETSLDRNLGNPRDVRGSFNREIFRTGGSHWTSDRGAAGGT